MPSAFQTRWAELLLGALARSGVRRVVLSPGSRSTPFAWAALREPELEVTTIVDERSAAFFALGQAKLCGLPSVLICTSGSAGAHYLPAVVEARYSGTPLIALTADRPLELQGSNAPQTIDQLKLFGDHVKGFFELGAPDSHPDAIRAAARIAAQAVLTSVTPRPGPVHLNARARKPLEPAAGAAGDPALSLLDAAIRRGPPRFDVPAPRVASDASVHALAASIGAHARGLLVAGPLSPARAHEAQAFLDLARASGWPLLAETPSQLRTALSAEVWKSLDGVTLVDTAHWLMRSSRAASNADVVLQLGGPLASPAWSGYLEGGTPLHVVGEEDWPDPTQRAHSVLAADAPTLARTLAAKLGSAPDAGARAEWREAWRLANADAWRVIDAELDRARAELSEPAAVRAIVDVLPPGSMLVLGNSLPIRDVDWFVPARGRAIRVVCQRGANGIDGLLSGACGVARASGAPTALVIGDVSLSHDVGALSLASRAEGPLLVAAIDNGGGRIFDFLPRGALNHARDFDAWLTPPRWDLEAIAKGFGVRYAECRNVRQLREAAGAALGCAGATLFHVRVAPTSTLDAHRAIDAALER
jgi:2-succinyl-5-enolpyruvyl-6-hydroxy-3-cyclohexene-1-carboxylate synthase